MQRFLTPHYEPASTRGYLGGRAALEDETPAEFTPAGYSRCHGLWADKVHRARIAIFKAMSDHAGSCASPLLPIRTY